MLLIKLALRNIIGAGLKTWLNVAALSFAFITIIFLQGLYEGMNKQAEEAGISALYGGGQYWHVNYNPFDPLTLDKAHSVIPSEFQNLINENLITPILIRQATIYPQGRFRTILLKGILPEQKVISLPTSVLKFQQNHEAEYGAIPAVIGARMAESIGLTKGDELTVQWRDVHGTFDARDVKIVEIFKTNVQEVDNDQIWIPLNKLQQITAMQNEATIIILSKETQSLGDIAGWDFKNLDFLLQDLHKMVTAKRAGGSIMYLLLLFLAMLAIFDTQVLSIWRRKKEMGTLMALGMTRIKVIKLFTLEGALHGVLAGIVGAIYGIPLLSWFAREGFLLPQATDKFGYALGEKIFPAYTAALIIGTAILVLIVTTIVSYLPTRKIAKLKPTEALRGDKL